MDPFVWIFFSAIVDVYNQRGDWKQSAGWLFCLLSELCINRVKTQRHNVTLSVQHLLTDLTQQYSAIKLESDDNCSTSWLLICKHEWIVMSWVSLLVNCEVRRCDKGFVTMLFYVTVGLTSNCGVIHYVTRKLLLQLNWLIHVLIYDRNTHQIHTKVQK